MVFRGWVSKLLRLKGRFYVRGLPLRLLESRVKPTQGFVFVYTSCRGWLVELWGTTASEELED